MIQSLPILLIEVHSRCNCRCVMCDLWKTTARREFTRNQLDAQMEAIEQLKVRWVVFTGGEPLMHSDLFGLAAPLRSRGIRVSVLSSGLLVDRFARQIVENIDDLIVSLDGPEDIHDAIRRVPGGFARIARGIRAVHALHPEFVVAARSVVQKRNHAVLTATAAAACRIGMSSISFLAADLTSMAFNRETPWSAARQAEIALTQTEIATLEREIDLLLRDPFVADKPHHLRRIVRHFRADLGLEPAEAPRCNAPWVSAVLGINGQIKPCFFHPPIGSGALDRALNSFAARTFREGLDVSQNPVCRSCVCSLHFQANAAAGG